MIVDVEWEDVTKRPAYQEILDGGFDAREFIPTKIDTGIYEGFHWNVDFFVTTPIEKDIYKMFDWEFDPYGVCDDYQQVIDLYQLDIRPEKYFVSLVPIIKAEQPNWGGWRWHKWGAYIGTQEPTCEYIYDEPVIEKVYTFHTYKVL